MNVIILAPTKVVGPFIRVWRQQWANLSRQQLANALTHRAKRPVSADAIREWENGQLPASTEELVALLETMEQHGLSHRAATHFSHIIRDCCVEGRYPGLSGFVDPDDLVRARDVDEIAGRLVRDIMIRLPDLAALAAKLEGIVFDGQGGPRSRRLAKKQRAALCYIRAGLVQLHEWDGRPGLMDHGGRTTASFIRANFGARGLDGHASPLPLECQAAYGRALVDPSSAGPVRRLVAIRNQALAEGRLLVAARAHFWALDAGPALSPAQAEALRAANPRMLRLAREASPDGRLVEPLAHIIGDALRAGRFADAEQGLSQLPHWEGHPGLWGAAFERWQGEIALAGGNRDEAERRFAAALAHARDQGAGQEEREARERLTALREG